MAEAVELFDPLDPKSMADAEVKQVEAFEDKFAKAQETLRMRRDAYKRFFTGQGNAYDERLVMGDLRKFCRGEQTAWAADPREHALLTGRQEVYQRIQDHLNLDFEELWERYNQVPT